MKTKITSIMNINAKSFLIFIFLLVLSFNSHAQFCSASGDCYKYIRRVQFSNIDNWSYCNNYYDFTAYTANVQQGYYYLLSVNFQNYYSSENDSCDVWIDWNNDTLFDNATEYYKLSNNSPNNSNDFFSYIKVPETASVGNIRMRIRVRSGGEIDPCGYANSNYDYGEVEDYTVNVSASSPMVLGNIYYNQFDGIAVQGENEVKIGLVKIVTSGGLNPLYIKNLNFNSLNSYPNISNANLYFTYNFDNYFNYYPFGNQLNSPSNQLLFSDSIMLLPDTNYFWLTYDVDGSATIGSKLKANLISVNINNNTEFPTAIDTNNSIDILSRLNGTYYINNEGNGDYISFNEAVNDLINRGVSGPVIFNVDPGTYNEQILIPSITGASETNTITFQSTYNDNATVTLIHTPTNNNDNYVISLQNASYITFQDLTIETSGSYSYGRIIYFNGNSNSNIVISENNINGILTSSDYDENHALIYSSCNNSSNISILNNNIYNGVFGVYFNDYGSSDNGNNIMDNTFDHQSGYGIRVYNQYDMNITNNYIYSDNYNYSFYGIFYDYGNNDLLINKNQIYAKNYNNIYGIYLSGFNGDALTSNISNNFISIKPNSYGNGTGIYLNNSTLGLYYNSVLVRGNNTNLNTLAINNCSGLVLKNNIFVNANNDNPENNILKIYSTCNNCISDYNSFFTEGTFAHIDTNNIPNIESWKSFTHNDSNSIFIYPFFNENEDLHTSNIFINGRGTPIQGITDDIDGENRNATTPDIGADEFDAPTNDLFLIPNDGFPSGCGLTNNERIEVVILNYGTSDYVAGNASIKFQLNVSQQLVNETINRNIPSGDTIHYFFNAGANLSVNTLQHDTTFAFKSWIEYSSDANHYNDTIQKEILSRYSPDQPMVNDTIIPYATSVTLNAQVTSDFIPIWYESLTSIDYLKIGNPITSPILYTPDTVFVTSIKKELGYSEIGTEYNTTNYPFYSYYPDSRTQIIYTAEELLNAGFVTGNINSLAFNIYSRSVTQMNGFNINMQNTSLSTLTSYIETGWTNVYSGTYSVPANGWQEIVFQNSFNWDGQSNILINICFDNNDWGSSSSLYCSSAQGKTWVGATTSAVGCNMTGGDLNYNRPNIRFYGTKVGDGCESNRVPLHVGISNTPSKDIGITEILLPNSGFEISTSSLVGVVVRNYGASTIDTMIVTYQKADTALPVTETIIRSLASGDTLHYYFAQTADITTIGAYNFKAYTSLSGDTYYSNDTTSKIVQNYTYCAPSFTGGCSYIYINNFLINTLTNNGSGLNSNSPGYYINYPENNFTTFFQKGINYPFSISQGSTYSIGYGIWIDLNHDGDFEDNNEFLYSTYTSSNSFNGNITIPPTYNYTGKTRMRIRALRYNYIYSNNSCTNYTECGETEDYTITILSPPYQKDVRLLSIVKPNDISTYQLISNDVIVNLRNIGIDTISQLPINYILNSQTPISYTWNGQLLPQQQINITLPQLSTNLANNNIVVYSSLTGDLDNSNDTLSKSFFALDAPAIISVNPDTINGFIASCDSTATQSLSFKIYNNGYQPLIYNINQNRSVSDNFENGLDKWIINSRWGLINQGYNGGYGITESPSGNYGDGWNEYIQLKDSLFIVNKDSCKIQFMLKYILESCCDRLNTQISVNNGSWNTIVSYGGNGSESWNLKQIPFNNYVNNGDYIKFRFYFYSDVSVVRDGVVIDDFSINGIQSGEWATLNTTQDTVAIGDSSIVGVTLTVGQLNAGTHNQVISIISNDPTQPNINYPINLTITGAPQIEIRDSIRNFPSIMAGVTATETFKIYNIGCDSLFITAINHNDVAFNTVFPSFIMPRDSAEIQVNFNTLTQGLHTDTLTIINNSEIKHIYLIGTILPTPQMILTPDSFYVSTSNCDDTLYYNMKVKNLGNATLNWNAYYSKGAEKSLSFSGSSSEVRFGNFGTMPQKGTVEFWMKASTTNDTKVLFSSSGFNYNWKGINVYQSYNNLYLTVGNDNGNTYNSYTITNNIDVGNWHHVAVSWDITLNRVWTYYDGNVVSNSYYNPNWPTTISDVRLGIGYHTYSNYYFNGEIDEFRIWSENRTATNIKNYYKESILAPTPSLIGLWGFNEVSGDTVYSFNNNRKGLLFNVTRAISGAKVNNTGIDVYPNSGVLNINDSSNVQVTFVTTGLNSGNHYSGIGVTSNDPLRQLVIIPTHLVLTGSPQFQLFENELNIDNIMAGATITDSVYFTNIGCDTLKVTNITHNNSVFAINQSSFTVLPKDTAKLKVTFNPIQVGIYNDTLTFISNAGNHQLFVNAVAVAAPVASVNPTSFTDTLTVCNQSITKYFKIRNTGNEILNWSGVLGGVGIVDNFDNGINNSNWSSLTNATSAASCGTAYGNNALYFGGDGIREITTKSLNTVAGGNISFYLKISGSGGSPCEQADGGEDVVLEYSINNGVNWNNINTYYTGYYSYFTPIQIAIPSGAQTLNTRFRWRQLSHSGSCCDHWAIDEVSVNTININNITPSSGTVAIGDSNTVQLIIDGQGLINGNYNSQVIINTNDPVHSQIIIPVNLKIIANPIITIFNNPFIMDTVMIGAESIGSLFIKNSGCDTLKITSITHDLTEFSYSPSTLVILPRDSAAFNITFTSLNVNSFTDTLRITSNAGNTKVAIKARTLGAPEIITLPDAITANIICDSNYYSSLKIKNPGIVPLNWSAFIENQEKGALQFNGVNNYVSLGYFSPGNQWSVEAWVKPDNLPYGNKLIAGSIFGSNPWGICFIDGKFSAIYRAQNGYTQTLIADNFTVSASVWYHVATVYNGSTLKIFINGNLIKSAIINSDYTAYSYPLIGGDPNYYSNYFSGSIDEVRIWNRARSQSQISYAMNHILVGNETGLVGYWAINKLNGSSITDLSGNGHNGSVSGATFTSNASPILGWVNLSNSSGSINVGDSTQINISINRHLLPQGTQVFKLLINSDDPVKPYDTTLITLNSQYNLIPVDIGSDTNLCTGNALTISAGSYSSYTWNDNSHNSTLIITNSGTYNVLVTDANGCEFSDTVQIGLTQPPVANGGLDKSICQSSSVSLNGSASGGTPPYQYFWKNEVQNIVSTYPNYSFVPTTTTIHYLGVIDNNGCESLFDDTVHITINPNPIVNAGADTTIDLGTSVTLNGSITNGTYPYTINWSPSYNMSATNILNPLLTPNGSGNYALQVTDVNNCTATDYVYVNIKYIVSGTVVYNNSSQTPMPNTRVCLENQSGVLLDSVLTNGSGEFSFSKVSSGNHYFYAKPSEPFKGLNATDALGIRRHIVNLSSLSGINYTAADVNNSSSISSADALLVLRRTVGIISNFASGDWISERKLIYISSNTNNLSIKVLCAGDVNGSYDFNSKNSSNSSINLKSIPSNINIIAGETYEMPIKIKQNIIPGAITLNFNYPSDIIEIIGVTSNGNDLEFNINKGIISVGYYNENGININENILLSIKFRTKPLINNKIIDLSLNNENEIADINGQVINNLNLEYPSIKVVENIDEFILEDNYPNPFSDISTIRVYVPEDASVNFTILNSIGIEMKTVLNEKLTRGWHEIKIKATDYPQGAYMYRIKAVGLNKTFEQTRRMIIIR